MNHHFTSAVGAIIFLACFALVLSAAEQPESILGTMPKPEQTEYCR